MGTAANGHLQAGDVGQGHASTWCVSCTPGSTTPAAMLTGGGFPRHITLKSEQQTISRPLPAAAALMLAPELGVQTSTGLFCGQKSRREQEAMCQPCDCHGTSARSLMPAAAFMRAGRKQTVPEPAQRFLCCQNLGTRCPGQPVTGCCRSVPVICQQGRQDPRHLQQQELPGYL